jgi:hypothetical protein
VLHHVLKKLGGDALEEIGNSQRTYGEGAATPRANAARSPLPGLTRKNHVRVFIIVFDSWLIDVRFLAGIVPARAVVDCFFAPLLGVYCLPIPLAINDQIHDCSLPT